MSVIDSVTTFEFVLYGLLLQNNDLVELTWYQ